MAEDLRVLKGRGSWTFFYPLGEVYLTPAVGREFRINRVTLVHKDRLPLVRKNFGLKARVSEIKKRGRHIRGFFENEKTWAYAVVRESGEKAEVERRCLELIKEELTILGVSQLGYSRRKQMGPILTPGEITSAHETFLAIDNRGTRWFQNLFRRTGPINQTVMDGRWKSFQDKVFFTHLLKILRGETKVEKGWRSQLHRATVLIGESVGSRDPLKSFLWNMIALEILLTRDDKEMKEALPRRMAALLDWVGVWWGMDYPKLIRDAYDKRNSLMHQGRRDELTEWDVEFTDHLLLHALGNLVRSSKLFPSKEAFIEFTKKIEAERTLGLKPKVQRAGAFMFIDNLKSRPPS